MTIGWYLKPPRPPIDCVAVGEARSMVSATELSAVSTIRTIPRTPRAGGAGKVRRSGVSWQTSVAPGAGKADASGNGSSCATAAHALTKPSSVTDRKRRANDGIGSAVLVFPIAPLALGEPLH